MIYHSESPLIDYESERMLLGSIMLMPDECFAFIDERGFDASMMVGHRHAMLFAAMRDIQDNDGPVEYVKVVQSVQRQVESPSEVVDYLTDAMEYSVGVVTGSHCVVTLMDLYRRRRLAETLERLSERACAGTEDVDALADDAMQAMLSLTGNAPVRKTNHIGDIAKLVRADFDYRLEHGDMRGPAVGFHEIDEMLKGMRGGDNYILAARPAMGKTQLALQMAENMAMQGTPVAFFSLEMADLQLGDRFIGSRAGVPAKAMRSPRQFAGPDEIQKVYQAVDAAAEIPLHIVDAVGMGMSAIRGEAKRLHATKGVRAIFIDYIGLIARRAGLNANDGVGENSRGVKSLARELNVPTVTLAQLNRKVETREVKMPMLSDLRDSGEIEQDADAVMMIHRPDYYRQQTDPEAELDYKAYIGICKHRNGPTGNVEIGFNAGRFFNPEINFGRH